MKIKVIIENIESNYDKDCNRYSYSVVTNTETGEASSFYMGWGTSEMYVLVARVLGLRHGDFKEFTKSIPIRLFNRRMKTHVDFRDSNSKDITIELRKLFGVKH